MALKTITDIGEVRAGDVAYFRHLTCGIEVIENDRQDDEKSLYVIIPKDFLFGLGNNWWARNSAFLYAEREVPDKKLPVVTEGEAAAFFTQSGRIVYYDGLNDATFPWNIWDPLKHRTECFDGEDLLDHLPASEFPLLKAIPGEVAE